MVKMDHTGLLVATGNPGKVTELRELLAGLPIDLLSLADFPHVVEVEETGATFAENALIKASGYARQTGRAALADDSGLEVAALDNRPGVLSARYAGEQTPFSEKIVRLLAELERSGAKDRSARFVCSIAVADENGQLLYSAEGICEGHLAPNPRGSGGFGYDPIFIPEGHDATFGELPGAVKNGLSHRARALAGLLRWLEDVELTEAP